MAGLVVIGYDGSHDAQRAVEFAAAVLRADTALVVNVWSTGTAMPQPGTPFGAPSPPSEVELRRLEEAALQLAEEGAGRARQAGLSAHAVVAQGASAEDIATTLCDLAETRDATLVVVGRRGLSRLKEVVLGSVSNAAVHDGRRPVLVVPNGER
jgi:nucleotide-binding universal stress UspA family protein